MSSVRFLRNPAVSLWRLTPSQSAALVRLLILLVLLAAFAAGWFTVSAPAASLVAPVHAAHTQLVDGPMVQCPGLSLPC